MPESRKLPPPCLDGPRSLENTLATRASIRSFRKKALLPDQIGQLLWAGQGAIHQRRTAPSAGAIYAIEIYLISEEGIGHYNPDKHTLEIKSEKDIRRDLYLAALEQESVQSAPVIIAICGVPHRIEVKYGVSRGPRYTTLEAGHVAQNILLQAVSLHLGAVPVGAFHDEQVHTLLGVPEDHQPIYLIPVGYPA